MTVVTTHPPHRWRSFVEAPVRLALAPLASGLRAVDAAVRRPSLVVAAAVLIVCVPGPLQNLGASATIADAVAGLAVIAVAVRIVAGDRIRSRRGWLPYAAVIVALAFATVGALDVAESVRGFVRYAELFVLVPLAVAVSVKDRLDMLLVAGALVATTVVEGAVGVYQSATGTGASYAGQYVRAVGTFGADQVLALGAIVGYGLLVTLALGLASQGRTRIALLAASAFLVVPLGLTLSRGAWIATAGAVLVLLIIASWRLTVALIGMAALAVAFFVLASSGTDTSGTFDERITSISSSGSAPDQSVQDRYELWHAALAIWADHPVVGVGLKDFAGYRDSYASVALSAGSDVGDRSSGISREPLLSAHNQYLMVLSEQGTVGILAFGSLLVSFVVGSLRRRETRLPAAEERFLDLAAPAVMVWTLIDFAYGDIGAGPTSVLLAVVLGLVARRSLITPGGRQPEGMSGAAQRSASGPPTEGQVQS